MMSSRSMSEAEAREIMDEVKFISGRRIEEKRRLLHMTQGQLAIEVGLGVRWLREIEAGNPKSRFDDHLRCAQALGLSAGHLLIPMLFLEHRMHFPRHLFSLDMNELELRCIDVIANFGIKPFLPRPWRQAGADVDTGGSDDQ